jgi:hypothetical protein
MSFVRCRRAILGLTFIAGCLSELMSSSAGLAQPAKTPATPAVPGPSTSPAKPPIPSADALKKWRAAIARVHPTKSGCFKSSYPTMQWRRFLALVQCFRPFSPGMDASPLSWEARRRPISLHWPRGLDRFLETFLQRPGPSAREPSLPASAEMSTISHARRQ